MGEGAAGGKSKSLKFIKYVDFYVLFGRGYYIIECINKERGMLFMTQITIDVEDTLANRLSEVAAQKNCSVSEYAAKLVSEHTPVKKLPRSTARGLLKGKVWMSDDFDAPLEEMKDYM